MFFLIVLITIVDVGVEVSRQDPDLNNLFRLPTAFDITPKLKGMQYFFLPSITGIVYLFLKRFLDVRRGQSGIILGTQNDAGAGSLFLQVARLICAGSCFLYIL